MTQIKSINLNPTKISLENRKKSHLKSENFFFIIMRLNLKAVLLCLSVAVIVITVSIYMRCSDFQTQNFYQKNGLVSAAAASSASEIRDLECNINQEYTVQCKTDVDNKEVYIPFSLIKQQFEISGNLVTLENGVTKFNWMHSNSKINVPKGKYDPRGIFMYFENYNVEIRDRVKCISAAEGVPISTQWEKRGYFYPTQIAQFGLSHYSKNFTEPEPSRLIIEDADSNQRAWNIPKNSNVSRIWIQKFNTTVVKFETGNEFELAVSTKLDQNHILQSQSSESDLVLSCDVFLVTNSSSLLVSLENLETKRSYNISYILSDLLISIQNENIYYGLGLSSMNHWKHLTRDLFIDLQKGLKGSKLRRSDIRITAIALLGIGMFDNLTLSTYDHMAHFYDAAEWFVNNQDRKTGGWPNPVRRNLLGFQELKSGWLSAMGQGHAISLLARAYWHSHGDKRYLRAASNGLKPFRIFSKDGGVLATFLGKYHWYEEYPTTPASYVLNGFIYSLLGLYDLNNTAPQPIAKEAGKLFRQGMTSLKKMLTLFDTGSGTNYDLRHFSLGVSPNLARWDYHATHVNQLLLLATIDNDPLISQTAERWKGYMFGKRAKHN